jgi:hypothetical protein
VKLKVGRSHFTHGNTHNFSVSHDADSVTRYSMLRFALLKMDFDANCVDKL